MRNFSERGCFLGGHSKPDRHPRASLSNITSLHDGNGCLLWMIALPACSYGAREMCLGGPESELGHMWLVALVLDETFVEGGQAGGPYP